MGRKTIGRFVTDAAAPVTVAAAGNILFASNTISTNAIAYDGNGGIQLKAPGVYRISANFSMTSTAAGTEQVQMFENGNAVPGAHAATTSAAIGNRTNLSFSGVTTVQSSCGSNSFATLTFKSAIASSYTIANVIIEKVA